MNVKKNVAKYIINIFNKSNKKNLIITGKKNIGKTTLANYLKPYFNIDYEILSIFEYKKSVDLSINKRLVNLAKFDGEKMSLINKNIDISDIYNYNSIFIDELGYLEEELFDYQKELINVFDKLKVLAVTRLGDYKFLNELKKRPDTLVINLDDLILPIGVVVMSSGMSKRFKSNKHLSILNNRYLIDYVIDLANLDCFKERLLLTRNINTFNHTNKLINSIIHNYELRSEAIRLGINSLNDSNLFGIMFLQGDQPYLKNETIINMVKLFSSRPDKIVYAVNNNELTSPIIFPNIYFNELINLDGKKGGKYIINNHLEDCLEYNISDLEKKDIDYITDLK